MGKRYNKSKLWDRNLKIVISAINGETYSSLALKYDISGTNIRQIYRETMRKMLSLYGINKIVSISDARDNRPEYEDILTRSFGIFQKV